MTIPQEPEDATLATPIDLGPRPGHRIIARQVDSTAGLLSGLGEHGLANRLWAVAGELRRGTYESPKRETR